MTILDKTFLFYGICLNRNRMIQPHCRNGNLVTPQIGNLFASSNRTNRQITVYFKGYALNEYPLNGMDTPFQGTRKFSGTLQYSHPSKYVTFCYPLEINVYDGHNTASFQKGITKRYSPNDSVLNNLRTTVN